MASGPVGGGFAQIKQPIRKLLIDPENFGLLGILFGMSGIAGYMAGRKAFYNNDEKNIKLAKKAPFPWNSDNSKVKGEDVNKDYKYKADTGRKAPNAITTTRVRMSMPKEMAEKISPKFFEEN